MIGDVRGWTDRLFDRENEYPIVYTLTDAVIGIFLGSRVVVVAEIGHFLRQLRHVLLRSRVRFPDVRAVQQARE